MVRFMRCDNKWFFILLYNFLYFPNFKQSAWIIFIRKKKTSNFFTFCFDSSGKERLYCRKDHRGEGRGASRGGARGLTQSTGSQSWTPYAAAGSPPRHWFSKSVSFLVSNRTDGAAPGTGWWEAESGVRKIGGQLELAWYQLPVLQASLRVEGEERGIRAFLECLQVPQDGKITIKPLLQKAIISPALWGCCCWND